MNEIFFLVGIGCGVAGMVALFAAAALRRRPRPNLAEGAVAFLSGAAVAAGLKVCYLALDTDSLAIDNSDRIYVFLGGVAVMWVSLDTIWTALRQRTSS